MIKKFIDSIAIDKKDHVLLGIIIGFPLVMLLGVYGGLIGIFLVGAKEVVHDWIFEKGNPEWWDFTPSAIPIVMFMILKYI
jgi:hypothetical protein|tara:strand:+ start:679 stop:921 length:243 start_codon:yes stop_codon:yes gene_type:complete